MAESEYTALPLIDTDHTGHEYSSNTQSSTIIQALKYALATCTVSVTIVVMVIIPAYNIRRYSAESSMQFNNDGDGLAPPILVVKPEMQHLHYCGLNPDDPRSIPRIPPLDDPEYELVQVQAFIRHGARFINSAKKCWPGQEHVAYNCSLDELATVGLDSSQTSLSVQRLYRKRYMENRNFFKGDCRLGQLTAKGYRQETALGGMFREAYSSKLLDDNMDPRQIFVRAHDISRTIISAQAFISGMFPEQSSNDGLIPLVDIWTMDANDEDEVINPHFCPGVDLQRENAQSSADYVQHEMTITQPINEKLSKVVGLPVDQLGTNKFDCFFVSLCQGDPVPDGIDPGLIQDLENEARYNLYYMMQYPDRVSGSRLTIGPLLREILDRMKSIDSSPRFLLYSGHDSGPIMLLLSAFAVEDEHWAPFASYISLEVYRRKDQYFVRFVYNGDVRHLPIGNNDNGLVALDVVEDYLKPMLPTLEECPQMRSFIS